SQNGLFTSITHEGSLDDMDAGMDIRDKLADKLLRFKIAPSPGVATHVAPPWQCSVRGKDSMSVDVAPQSLRNGDSASANPAIPAAAPVAAVEAGVLPEFTGKTGNPVHQSVSLDNSGSLTPAPPEMMGPSPGLTASPPNRSKASAAVSGTDRSSAPPAAADEGAGEDLLLQLVVNDEAME